MLTIELHAAPLPKPLTNLAVHLFLLSKSENRIDRWELWQTKNAFQNVSASTYSANQKSNGHIHVNLKAPKDGVGGGPSYFIKRWTEEDAERIQIELNRSFDEYRHKNNYLAWPGPNSNTYISSVLKSSKVSISLPTRAIGKDYFGLTKFHSKPYLQYNLLTFGLSKSKEFIELHALGLTLSYNIPSNKFFHPLSK